MQFSGITWGQSGICRQSVCTVPFPPKEDIQSGHKQNPELLLLTEMLNFRSEEFIES